MLTPGVGDDESETPSWLKRAESKIIDRTPLNDIPTPNTMFRMMCTMQQQMQQMQQQTQKQMALMKQRDHVMAAIAGLVTDGPARASSVVIASVWRRVVAMRVLRRAQANATRLQSNFRGRRGRMQFRAQKKAATTLEACGRRMICVAAYAKARLAATTLQVASRRRAAQHMFAAVKAHAALLQAVVRSRSNRRAFLRKLGAAKMIQAHVRQYATLLHDCRRSKSALTLRSVKLGVENHQLRNELKELRKMKEDASTSDHRVHRYILEEKTALQGTINWLRKEVEAKDELIRAQMQLIAKDKELITKDKVLNEDASAALLKGLEDLRAHAISRMIVQEGVDVGVNNANLMKLEDATASLPHQSTAVWEEYDGTAKQWVKAPTCKCFQNAPTSMSLCGDLEVKTECLGTYFLAPQRTAHGKPVWKHATEDRWIAWASDGKWKVQPGVHVGGVNALGFMKLEDTTASLPHQSTAVWEVYDGKAKQWVKAPTCKCFRDVPTSMSLCGELKVKTECLGTYFLAPQRIANGKPVWKHATEDRWIAWASDGKWMGPGEGEVGEELITKDKVLNEDARAALLKGRVSADMVKITVRTVKEDQYDIDVATSDTAPSPAPAPAPPAPVEQQHFSPAEEEKLSMLEAMGFPREMAVAALRAAFGDADRAVQYLMDGIPDDLTAAIEAGVEQGLLARELSDAESRIERLAEQLAHTQRRLGALKLKLRSGNTFHCSTGEPSERLHFTRV